MNKTKRFMDGGQIPPNTYPFADKNAQENSVKVGSQPEPLGDVTGAADNINLFKRGGKVKKYADGGKADYAIPDARARAAMDKVKEEEEQGKAEKAYKEAAPRSMGTFKEKAPKPPTLAASKPMAKGGSAKCYAKGGSVRGGGCEVKGKTKGRMV